MKYFLTIAASDNSGGAGIQQDLKVAEKLGFWGLSAITGITVQNFNKLDKVFPVDSDILSQQIDNNINSFEISAVKIGAVCGAENIVEIASLLSKHKLSNIVLDTVFAPTSGERFIKDETVNLFKEKLLPFADIVTPNKNEISQLTGIEINDFKQGVEAAILLSKKYNCKIYLKGGHFNDNEIKEALIEKEDVTYFKKERLNFNYSHGTGCAFSSALSCYMGLNYPIKESCKMASEFVSDFYKLVVITNK